MRKKSDSAIKESVLTEWVRKDFEEIGYTTYAEVCVRGGGDKRCDMYARQEDKNQPEYGRTIVFEAKLTFNFKVIEQAYFWKNRAHEVYIIVPSTHKNMSTRRFAREVCRKLGIGVMEVNLKSEKYNITVKPEWCSNPKYPMLYNEQKFVIASNSDNKYMTPFKITVMRINEHMKDKDKELITKLVREVKHHYKGDIAAVRAIKFLVERNVIPGYFITKENNKLMIKKNTLLS